MGRQKKNPDPFPQASRETFLDLLRQGARMGEAARAVGHTRKDVLAYQRTHPEFGDDVQDATMESLEQLETQLWEKAKAGNVAAILRILQRHDPSWSDKHQLNVTTKQEPLSVEELRQAMIERGYPPD